MNKIPTVFTRDPEDQSRLTREVHPDCQWVLDGEGTATRKYDGTCVMLDIGGSWLARREVKAGKAEPDNYRVVERDPITGKSVGWEPIGQSGWAKWHAEALARAEGTIVLHPGTYELVGPKVNGNPEDVEAHTLVRHAEAETLPVTGAPRDYDAIKALVLGLAADYGWEGVVYHHDDGRMAKIKARDYRNEP